MYLASLGLGPRLRSKPDDPRARVDVVDGGRICGDLFEV